MEYDCFNLALSNILDDFLLHSLHYGMEPVLSMTLTRYVGWLSQMLCTSHWTSLIGFLIGSTFDVRRYDKDAKRKWHPESTASVYAGEPLYSTPTVTIRRVIFKAKSHERATEKLSKFGCKL